MGSKYKGNPYKNTKYNLGAYPSKTTIQPQPKETPIRIKTKDKPKESKKERYRKKSQLIMRISLDLIYYNFFNFYFILGES